MGTTWMWPSASVDINVENHDQIESRLVAVQVPGGLKRPYANAELDHGQDRPN